MINEVKYNLKDYFSKLNPDNIKSFNITELKNLADKLRKYILEVVSKNGGHLSSNLGIVELIISLLYVFNLEKDRIVFDVGHQVYPFKILTGRAEYFDTLRKKGGISGFTDPEESKFDIFKTGHVGTAIGMTYGFIIAKEFYTNFNKDEFYRNIIESFKEFYDGEFISVIGDGSLTNGEILETLNFIGNIKNGKIIIIINDNGMFISKTESAVSKYISKLSARLNIRGLLKKIYLNKKITSMFYKILTKLILSIKSFFIPESILEEFGFQYIGPIDGHNIKELIDCLKLAKEIESPVILHVKTIKGKGYQFSEKYSDLFHSSPSFDINKILSNEYENYINELFYKKRIINYTDFFQKLILFSGFVEKRVFTLTSAMSIGTGLSSFSKIFPERFLDVGIAESTQVTLSASLSKAGFIPVCCIYSTFAQRSLDQIYHDVILNKLRVIFCFDRYGAVGNDGPTHHGFYTLNFLISIPDIEIYMPFSEEDFFYYFMESLKSENSKAFFYPKDKICSIFNSEIINSIKDIDIENCNEPNKKNISYYFNEIYKNKYEFFIKEFESNFEIDKNPYKFKNYLRLTKFIIKQNNIDDNKDIFSNNYDKKIAIIFTGAFFLKIKNILNEILENNKGECLIELFSLTKIKPFPEEETKIIIQSFDFIFIIEEVIEPGYILAKFLEIKNFIEKESVFEKNSEEKLKIKDNKIYNYCIKNKIIYHSSREEQLNENGINFEKLKNDLFYIINKN